MKNFKQIFKGIVLLALLIGITQGTYAAENSQGNVLGTTKIEKFTAQLEGPDVLMIQKSEKSEIIVFTRKGCTACHKEIEFLTSDEIVKKFFQVQFLDIGEKENKEQWEEIVERHKLSKVTPITLIGGDVLVGFSEKVLSKKIEDNEGSHKKYELEFYLGKGDLSSGSEEYSCKVESASTCSLEQGIKNTDDTNQSQNSHQVNSTTMTLPFFGEVDTKKSSLFAMASILGFIDGFNPCAMWVLLTFLVILSQVGDRKKMLYLAGLFIIAEGIMYFLILNIWYQTWDFIQLDQFVTPLVGTIAIGGGLYFLYKWHKGKGELSCSVTSLKHQQKTVAKIKNVVSKPITIITTLAVLGIAFSVNIIEFACSVGIAQSFTKILELNELTFILRQWYLFVYSLFYMADDFLIFGLAIFGYQKFTTVGAKYSHLSSLIGGILMIILGALLILRPEWLG